MLHFSLFLSIFFVYPEPTPPTIVVLVSSTSVNFGESWPDHPRSSQRTQSTSLAPNTYNIHLVPNMVILVASGSLAPSGFVLRLQRFWSGPLRTQPSDSGYKPLWCSMLIQTINTVRSFWYRSTSKTFGGNSRINDHFLFCQRLRPTIARFAISPTNETATYRKCKPFLAGGSCSDRPVSIRTRLE
ncbi:hypothetical protein Smp_023140 [Schistosoma mansoni]|uniref:hypothetical protein n=1 Tax=Schistosoma mansoni TaxID=6183 RepID=UPI0001A6417C|nr:hypothetical protein Smp_023140 [Schistosoma mansoni]|eukprot:XP_018650170.1 hypothetical protein Smp_023140 [Schistosoma mansoni]